jgi:hypothetical protein
MCNNERAPPVGCEENNQQGNQRTDVMGIEQQKRRTMIRCNVTVCGVVSRVATCRTNKDGQPFVTFAMNVVVPAKSGINKTIEVSVLKNGTLTEIGNIVTGQRIEVVGTLIPKKRGDVLYFNMTATGINSDTTATEDSIVGQMEFRGKAGKNIEEKQSKKGEPYLMFSAFSAEKVQDGFEYLWVRFVRFGKEREEWLVSGCKVTAKGEMELSVYNDRLGFSCKVDELAEYMPQPYNPQN